MSNEKYETLYYESEPNEELVAWNLGETALLIVDMQKQFILRDFGDAKYMKEIGEWEKWEPFHDRLDNIAVPNNKKLLDYFRKNSMEVTFGRIACHHKDGRDRSPVQRKQGWNNILLPMGSYEAEMIDELKPLEDEIVVNKTTDSVPAGTNYTFLLRNMGIKNVVVTGIVTDQCVASTVRSLADEGFDVIVAEDGCAAATDELHFSELRIMNNLYCKVMETDEVIDLLNKIKEGE